ncbi:hypothetical protein PTD2_07084 [Pseudoalteromonas tunicata D2]|uniref:Uncharacterized protein n=1 Tax=Pseudoalteromonas tunicata D2 TaxID=87626 RepID=A4C872_9GAMM|nr:hypothetical protein PTD2_07084 [Pseudoalteromonas tunicata D2]
MLSFYEGLKVSLPFCTQMQKIPTASPNFSPLP